MRKIEFKSPFRFIDLFAGLGGFHLAAQRLGGECVLACEIEDHLQDVYLSNFGIKPYGDIRSIIPSEVPEHDLLCAGFPCQPFSKAGGQMGWDDPVRGTVFWNIVEILRLKRPKLIILENVAHFVRHDSGNTYQKVKESLESLGYAVDYHQYSPHQFGIPQIRERIYMIARLGSLEGFAWPNSDQHYENLSIKNILDKNPSDATNLSLQVVKCLDVWQEFLDLLPADAKLPSFPIWSMEFGATYPFDRDSLSRVPLAQLQACAGSFGKKLKNLTREEIYLLVPSHARGHRGTFPKWKKTFIKQNRDFFALHKVVLKDWLPKIMQFPPSLQKLEWNCQGEKRDIWQFLIQFRASGVRLKRATTSPSLVAMTTTQIPIIGWERRYMTAREGARLQSMNELKNLPNGFAAMKALGNAVNVTVVEKILENLLPLLENNQEKKSRPSTNNQTNKKALLEDVF